MESHYKLKGKKYFNISMTPDIEVDEEITEEQIYSELEQLLSKHKGLIRFFKIGFVEIIEELEYGISVER